MEPEQTPVPKPPKVEKNESLSNLHTVTSESKLLTMALFITLPFVGGWIGYTYAPEKIVEVEKVVLVETEPEMVIPTPYVADLPLPESTDSVNDLEKLETGTTILDNGLRRTVTEDIKGRVTIEETYAPEVFPLNPTIFAEDMQNSSVCLNEWQEVMITIPTETNNILLRPLNNGVGTMTLNLFSETQSTNSVLKRFTPYAVTEDTSATYIHRWILGEEDDNEYTPDDLYRYRVTFTYPGSNQTFLEGELVGEQGGTQRYTVESNPFVVRDCGV